jgi:YD repeat-containing protein
LITSLAYDPIYNKPTRITDPLGLVSTLAYDGATGNLLKTVADAGGALHLNAATSYTYNGNRQVVSTTDPVGTNSQLGYDSQGNRIWTIRDYGQNHSNQLTRIAYDKIGNAIAVTDPNGNTTTSTYDAARRLTSVTTPGTAAAPSGLMTTNTYDRDGRVVQVQQSANGVVLRTASATYTPTGQPATTTDANGNVTTDAYDPVDRLSSVTDAMGRVATYGYDALSRRTSVRNPAIQSTPLLQQSYTPDGLVGSLTDANNNTTSFTPDGFDRLSTATYPGSSTETFSYDADSNVLTRKTRAGATISFIYDTLNRLSTKIAPSEGAEEAPESLSLRHV